jgi:hypothetical protein
MMGYSTIAARGDIIPELVEALPNLKGKTHDLRLWSVRRAPEQVRIDGCESEEEKSGVSSCLTKIDDLDPSLTSFFPENEELPDQPLAPIGPDVAQETENWNW